MINRIEFCHSTQAVKPTADHGMLRLQSTDPTNTSDALSPRINVHNPHNYTYNSDTWYSL